MTKNRSIKIAVLVLALALITSCFVGTTFAKYQSTATGNASALVAKWDVKLNGTAISNNFDFDLFAAVNEVVDNKVTANDDTEVTNTRLVDENAVSLIAPGTGGSVTIALSNASEVTAVYSVAFTANEAEVPLKWSKTNNGTDWAETVESLNITDADFVDGAATITLYYMWAFGDEASIAGDTALGVEGSAQPTVSATVTVTQKD